MSKVSEYIHEHVNFLNMLLPILKVVVDAAPVPPQIKTDFDAVYARAPGVILAGAAAVQAVTGQEQPAAVEVAGAFGLPSDATVVASAPAPMPVAPAPVITQAAPAPMNQQTPTAPLIPSLTPPPPPPTLVPEVAAPAVVTFAPASVEEVPTPPDLGPTVDMNELAKLAQAMGLKLVAANGQPIS